MSLEVKLKMSYKQEKSMKKLYGKLQGRQIAFGRQMVKLVKNAYAQPERLNPETSKEDAIV